MRIVLPAGDFSQSKNLEELAVELKRRGHAVESFLAFGKKELLGNPERASEEASQADLVVVGICDNNLVDLAVCKAAIESGGRVKLGLLSTGYASHRHEAFVETRAHADLVILSEQGACEETQRLFPKAKVVVTGDPIWDQHVFDLQPQEEVAKLLEIEAGECVILAPLVRDTVRDFLLAKDLAEAALLLKRKDGVRPRVIFGLHPGDKPEGKEKMRRLASSLSECIEVPIKVTDRNADGTTDIVPVKTTDIVPVCNIVVTSISSVDTAAAMWEKPSIAYLHWDADEHLRKLFGDAPWQPTDVDMVSSGLRKASAYDLYAQIKILLTPEGYAFQKQRQEHCYPRPTEKGAIIRTMADEVEKLFR